jgi:glutathione S-transferase
VGALRLASLDRHPPDAEDAPRRRAQRPRVREDGMLELYHSGHTTCSKQVRQCLTEKGIAYVSRYIELWSYENLGPDYLRLNPNGVVPTLVHDGVPLINSFCIMEYVEDVFPDRPLRPADPVDRAKQRLWSWIADDVHPSVANATYSTNMRGRHRNMDRATVDKVAAMMPVPERRDRFLRTAGEGFSDRELDLAWARISFVLDRLEGALGAGPWIVGAFYSLADVAMLAIVDRIKELKPEMIAPTRLPRVAAWHAASLARPAAAKVYAHDTDEVPRRPDRIAIRATG